MSNLSMFRVRYCFTSLCTRTCLTPKLVELDYLHIGRIKWECVLGLLKGAGLLYLGKY